MRPGRRWPWWSAVLSLVGVTGALQHDMKGFDDSVLFGLAWPGPELLADSTHSPDDEIMKIMTANRETYECYLPKLTSKEASSGEMYDGPSPLQLLKPLFAQKICSYRLESYWSYELCHGRYVRQYHEEREGKKVKLQEYYLGKWSAETQKELDESPVEDQATAKPKYTKIDGISLPYLEVVMDDGTVCDLSGKPRLTKVHYVCYKHGKHEVYSFKETSTCEYEILILSPLLCAHPKYKPQETGENLINCVSIDGSPKKPRSLLAMEAESLKLRHQTVRLAMNDKDAKDVVAVLKVEKIEKDGETHLKFELHPLEEEGTLNEISSKSQKLINTGQPPSDFHLDHKIADNSPVKAFLNGENCLNGGTGWWKYEFCYGQSVEQYHVDRSGTRTSVLLGKFDEKKHLEWIKENPHKAPKPAGPHRKSISHLYAGGELCDRTGKPRQTEVKLKCLENSSSAGQVSLYLLEPRTCQYILGVESPLICDILPLADDNGLVKLANSKPFYDDKLREEEEDTTRDDKEEKPLVDNMNFVND